MMDPGGSTFLFFLPVILLAVLGFGTVIGLSVRAGRRDRTRAQALRDWARGREFEYREQDRSLGRTFLALPGERGSRFEFTNVLRGRLAGVPLTVFDYGWTTSGMTDSDGHSSSDRHHRRVVALELPAHRPPVTAEPVLLGGRIARALGSQHLTIGVPELDRRYRVRADDAETARAVLLPLAEVLIARPDQVLELDGPFLLLYRPGQHTVDDLEGWLDGLAKALTAGELSQP